MKTSVLMASVGAGVGTLGVGGLLVHNLLKKDQKETVTVHNELTKKGHEFLSFKEGKALDTWKEIAKAYSKSTKNRLGNLTITIPSIGNKEASDADIKKLKKACQDLINTENYTKESLLSAEQWCVKPITIKDLISKHRKILNLETSKDLEQSVWDTKVENYLKADAKNQLPNTALKSPTTNNKKADRDKLRADCTKVKDKKTHDVDFHENYASFNEWCTLPKENSTS